MTDRLLDPQPDPAHGFGDIWGDLLPRLPERLRPYAVERRQQGIERYGVTLSPFNGRIAYLQPIGGASGICGAPADGWLPELADPATGGAMLELLERSLTVSLQSVRGRGWLVAAWGEAGQPLCVGAASSIGEAAARVALSVGRWA